MAKPTPQDKPTSDVPLTQVIAAAASSSDQAEPGAVEAAPLRRAFVRTVYGPMVNVLTAEPLTEVPKKVNIDQWVQAQLEAGKLVEGEPE